MSVDQAKVEEATRLLLEAIGEDPSREGLQDTPRRVAKAWAEMLNQDEPAITAFTEECDELVLVRDIAFHSFCEHHLLPFMGVAHIAYIPGGKVLGLSKLVRILDYHAKRLQVQERLTKQIADLLDEQLQARGVAVMLEATHTCMTIRGVRKPGSVMVTSAIRGLFRTNIASRSEVMSLLQGHRPPS